MIDALCMELVVKPETFDCLLLPNLYGDIVSDLAAVLAEGKAVTRDLGGDAGTRAMTAAIVQQLTRH